MSRQTENNCKESDSEIYILNDHTEEVLNDLSKGLIANDRNLLPIREQVYSCIDKRKQLQKVWVAVLIRNYLNNDGKKKLRSSIFYINLDTLYIIFYSTGATSEGLMQRFIIQS